MLKNETQQTPQQDLKTLVIGSYVLPLAIQWLVFTVFITQKISWSRPTMHLEGVSAVIFAIVMFSLFGIGTQIWVYRKAFEVIKKKFDSGLVIRSLVFSNYPYVVIVGTFLSTILHKKSVDYYLAYDVLILVVCFLFQRLYYKKFFRIIGINFKPSKEKIHLNKKHL